MDIDSGEVTGPSAGMAWALAVIDRLTPGSITDGREVAVTGEILADGSIGTIGGITQKVAAVKRAGVTLFLYPADTPEDEQREMRRIAGDEVELRPVADAPGGRRGPRSGRSAARGVQPGRTGPARRVRHSAIGMVATRSIGP